MSKLVPEGNEYSNEYGRNLRLDRFPDQVSDSLKRLSGMKMLRNIYST